MTMKKMKSLLFLMVVSAILVPTVQASLTYLPNSSYYNGQNDKTFDLGAGETITIHLEFAVYEGDEAETMQEITGYTGSTTGYVYAYQIFCDESNTAALTSFSLTGINPGAISSVTDDIGQIDSVTAPSSEVFDSYGEEPTSSYFNGDVTEAIWEFEDGALIQGENSWFLLLYSDHDWIAGDYEVEAIANDDIPMPGAPEPTTLILLAGGAVLSLRRRK